MRFQIHLFASVLVLTLASGCTLHLPESVKSIVSDRGAHAIRVIETPAGIYFTSLSFLPGTRKFGDREDLSEECNSGATVARVYYASPQNHMIALEVCNAILSAINYISRYGHSTYRIEYEALIVDPVERAEIRKVNFYPFSRKIVPRFAFKNSARIQNSVVAVFAHEYVHMALSLREPSHQTSNEEEFSAYLAELCAQLEVLGAFKIDDLPGAPIPNASEALARSSEQAYRVRALVAPLLINGELRAVAPRASELIRRCDHHLFSMLGGQSD